METQHTYTIEEIDKLRNEKKEEVRQSKGRLQQLGKDLLAPQENEGRLNTLMRNVNMCIAAYDGIMTGMKILQRVKTYFKR